MMKALDMAKSFPELSEKYLFRASIRETSADIE